MKKLIVLLLVKLLLKLHKKETPNYKIKDFSSIDNLINDFNDGVKKNKEGFITPDYILCLAKKIKELEGKIEEIYPILN